MYFLSYHTAQASRQLEYKFMLVQTILFCVALEKWLKQETGIKIRIIEKMIQYKT